MLQNKETNNTWFFPTLVLLAGAVYAYFSFTAPPTEAGRQLGISDAKFLLIQITFTVPFVATWFLGSLAAKNLKRYAERVTVPSVALGYRYFATGVVFLVVGAVLAQIAGLPRNFYEGDATVIAPLSIAINYINVVFPLIGFLYFFRGAKLLSSSAKTRGDIVFTSSIIVALLGGIYTLLIFTNPTRQFSETVGVPPTYYLSDILIAITIIVPVLVAWFFGFRAALTMGEIQGMTVTVGRGFSRLMIGIWLVVFSSIILQGIVSLGTARFLSLGLGVTLALVYFFLVIIAAGYWFAASGSKKLLD